MQRFSSQDFSPKTAKQCRERWNNQLSPKVKLSALSEDEIRNVFLYHSKFGNRWSKIANKLKGRTDNIVKNYFLCRLRRLTRCIKRRTPSLVIPNNEEEFFQTLYLIDYLYKYYISSERKDNIVKSLNPQTRKRRNDGDRYINQMVTEEGVTTDKLSSFVKELKSTCRFPLNKHKMIEYNYLLSLSPKVSNSNLDSLSNLSHNEDIKNATIVSTVSKPSATLMTSTMQSFNLKLPLPNFETPIAFDAFKPTFCFESYSVFPCLGSISKKAWSNEMIETNVKSAQ